MPVVKRPELPGIPLGAFDEVSLVIAHRVAHWPISLCTYKREVPEAGYEGKASSRRGLCGAAPMLRGHAHKHTSSCGCANGTHYICSDDRRHV